MAIKAKKEEEKTESVAERPKNYLDILSGQCRAMAEKFRLSGEQTDELRQFVTDVAMKAWKNGRAVGFIRAQAKE